MTTQDIRKGDWVSCKMFNKNYQGIVLEEPFSNGYVVVNTLDANGCVRFDAVQLSSVTFKGRSNLNILSIVGKLIANEELPDEVAKCLLKAT